MPTPGRPLLVYDGACAFCRCWIDRWRRVTGPAVDYEPSATAAARFPAIPPERFRASVVLIEPDGRVTVAAEAVLRTLAGTRSGRLLRGLYERVPPFARASEAAYRFVAAHRSGWARVTRCRGER